MNKRTGIGSRLRAVRTRIERVGQRRLTLSTFLIGGFVVLVIGIGIGGSTNIWTRSLQIAGVKPDVPALDFSSLQDIYGQLATTYDGKVDPAKLLDGARHGMVGALGDPYTAYFNAEEAKSFNDDLSGKFSGIGAALTLKDNVVTVASVLKDSPAQSSGLQAQDSVIQVNGTSTEGWSLDKAVTAIRGEAGSSVKLTVNRGGDVKEFTITRAALTNPSVTSDVKDGIGTLTISRFGDDTSSLARSAAAEFKQANVKGVILDLRGNGGGQVDAAQNVAGLWLNNKLVMTARTNGAIVQTIKTGDSAVLNGIPTIVLIDGGSASASEIVAAALHDNGAATLYGQKSFGKGSEQTLLQYPGDALLKITIARWYTPNGKNIDKTGIQPDTTITPTSEQISAGQDPVKDAAFAKLNG